jgi:hypothetical protein
MSILCLLPFCFGSAFLTITVVHLCHVFKRLKGRYKYLYTVRSSFTDGTRHQDWLTDWPSVVTGLRLRAVSLFKSFRNAWEVLRFLLTFPDIRPQVWNNDNSVITWGTLTFRFCYRSCLFVLSIHNQSICLLQNPLLCIPIWNVYIYLIKSK